MSNLFCVDACLWQQNVYNFQFGRLIKFPQILMKIHQNVSTQFAIRAAPSLFPIPVPHPTPPSRSPDPTISLTRFYSIRWWATPHRGPTATAPATAWRLPICPWSCPRSATRWRWSCWGGSTRPPSSRSPWCSPSPRGPACSTKPRAKLDNITTCRRGITWRGHEEVFAFSI